MIYNNEIRKYAVSSIINRGAEIINTTFSTSMPTGIDFSNILIVNQEQNEQYDYFYIDVACLVFNLPDTTRSANFCMQQNKSIFSDMSNFDEIKNNVLNLHNLSDTDLELLIDQRFSIMPVDLTSTFDFDKYNWTKINHGWWELVSGHALHQCGLLPGRFLAPNYYEQCASPELIRRAISALPSKLTNEELDFISDDWAFAISFNAGSIWQHRLRETLTEQRKDDQLPEFIRGAMLGASPFLTSATGATRFRLADGASAKQIAYSCQLPAFCEQIKAWSDTIVFIVPYHLRDINISGWTGPTIKIIVPSRLIHELWPSTLAFVAGALEDISKQGGKTTILAQAAVMSMPIGVLAQYVAQELNVKMRYYDLGQVLDLAQPLGQRTQKWARDLEDIAEYRNIHLGSFVLDD